MEARSSRSAGGDRRRHHPGTRGPRRGCEHSHARPSGRRARRLDPRPRPMERRSVSDEALLAIYGLVQRGNAPRPQSVNRQPRQLRVAPQLDRVRTVIQSVSVHLGMPHARRLPHLIRQANLKFQRVELRPRPLGRREEASEVLRRDARHRLPLFERSRHGDERRPGALITPDVVDGILRAGGGRRRAWTTRGRRGDECNDDDQSSQQAPLPGARGALRRDRRRGAIWRARAPASPPATAPRVRGWPSTAVKLLLPPSPSHSLLGRAAPPDSASGDRAA
jgi:hypothetical protein